MAEDEYSDLNLGASLSGYFTPYLTRKLSILNGYFEHANVDGIKCGLKPLRVISNKRSKNMAGYLGMG